MGYGNFLKSKGDMGGNKRQRYETLVFLKKNKKHATSAPPPSPLKAHTHRLILRGLAAESAVEWVDSIPESADSATDLTIVGRLSISNMFDISNPLVSRLLESADGKSAQWVRDFKPHTH